MFARNKTRQVQRASTWLYAHSSFVAGYSGAYQLGTGSEEDQPVPVLISDGGSATYRSVACGDSHTCALRADGQMVCFGDNSGGKCGDGTFNSHVQTPGAVAGGIVFKHLVAGGTHTCGLRKSDGRAMCFGGCRDVQLRCCILVPKQSVRANIAGGTQFCGTYLAVRQATS